MSVVKEKKRPVKELRDQLRRDQIVSAARACVVRHGFHAASMGQIAAEAQMSVGQIYRYFPSKDAIVRAIVERIVARRLEWMVDRDKHVNFAARFANRHDQASEEERSERVLLLEITAEATRNPAVAEIARAADRRLRSQAVELVRGGYPELSEQEAAVRVEFVSVLSEGSAFRSLTEPVAAPALLESIYRDTLQKLFPRMTDRELG
ncbi:TetR/AcrR family transcriptional regulator [Steroidobacter sp.]|uniref:TetR/AcrR family transcriptional regulator n=1 Tax=Steroidobacter sp. TaxID=1978227 RepID=UPI001A401CB7|nr:TetR/AcrR family transcriptional regulator [Steroidobacter sp.]MBL8270795.1 TetR/AcrR family transcriptional regulator [Steroidobacter sp.]